MGEIHVRLSVSYGERVGYVSFDDLILEPEQLELALG